MRQAVHRPCSLTGPPARPVERPAHATPCLTTLPVRKRFMSEEDRPSQRGADEQGSPPAAPGSRAAEQPALEAAAAHAPPAGDDGVAASGDDGAAPPPPPPRPGNPGIAADDDDDDGSGGGDGAAAAGAPCPFFMRTGTCAYGAGCRFAHPRDRPPTQLNSRGLPLRADALVGCPYAPFALRAALLSRSLRRCACERLRGRQHSWRRPILPTTSLETRPAA